MIVKFFQESFLQLEKVAKAEKDKEALSKQAKASAQEVCVYVHVWVHV